MLVLLGVAAAAVLVIRKTRGQRATLDAPRMTLRATMSLGAKAKVVLLSADDRELLVAVDAKGVRLLDSWNRGETPDGTGGEGAVDADEALALAPDDFASLVARSAAIAAPGRRAATRAGTQTQRPATETQRMATHSEPDAPYRVDDRPYGSEPQLAAHRADNRPYGSEPQFAAERIAPERLALEPRPQPRLVTRHDDLDDEIDGSRPRPRTQSDQISGLLRLRHEVRAEDAAGAEPTDGESPWAQHLMASLRRGKPS